MRDEFSEKVKRIVAARTGHRCSRPSCGALTSGPQVDPAKSLNIGVAAHITAASPGGPRYDAALSQEDRCDIKNAIWLCQTCGKLVDNDENGFTADDLQQWKSYAETAALAVIGRNAVPHAVGLAEWRNRDLIHAYLKGVAAQNPYFLWSDQNYIQRAVRKTEDTVARTASPYSRVENSNPVEALPDVLDREEKMILLGEPGMGKTTTLQYLAWKTANCTLAALDHPNQDLKIPIYIELKTYGGETELETLLAIQINRFLRPRNLMLAPDLPGSTRKLRMWFIQPKYKFLLLIDGLNEVRPEFHTPVRNVIRDLFNSPHAVIVTCRERDYDGSMPCNAASFTLEGLQKAEIVKLLKRTAEENGGRPFYDYMVGKKISTLASNPLILWLISVIMKDDSDKIGLLGKRGRLFQQFITRMPLLRTKEGIRPDVPLDIVIATLADLAFAMQEIGTLTAELKDIRKWKLPTADRKLEQVLGQAKEWRFLKSDGTMGEQVEFLHQLFLEFFVAFYLDKKLGDSDDYETMLAQRPLNPRWDEVIEILGGISKRPAGLIVWLNELSLAQKDWRLAALAARCLKAGNAVYDKEACLSVVRVLKIAPLDSDETHEIRDLPEELVETLKQMGNPLALEPLISVLEHAYGWPAGMHAAKALGQIGNRQAVAPLIKVVEDSYDELDRAVGAMEALAELGASEAVEPLLKFSQEGDSISGPHCFACEDAIWAVEKLVNSDAVRRLWEILTYAKESVDNPPLADWETLALDWPRANKSEWFDDPLHLGAMYSLMQNHDPRLIRPLSSFQYENRGKKTGLEELVSHSLQRIRDLQDAHPELALLNPDPEVRRCAVIILGEEGNPRKVPLLERVIQEDRGRTLFGTVADAAQAAKKRCEANSTQSSVPLSLIT
jgi:HEAT repeat protein